MRITFRENLAIALATVSSHRLRSFLTIIGIVVGIATVVTVSSLLTGLRTGIVVFFEELGPDNIFIQQYSGGGPDGGGPPKERHRKPVRPEYADAITRLCPSVLVVAKTIFQTMSLSEVGTIRSAQAIGASRYLPGRQA